MRKTSLWIFCFMIVKASVCCQAAYKPTNMCKIYLEPNLTQLEGSDPDSFIRNATIASEGRNLTVFGKLCSDIDVLKELTGYKSYEYKTSRTDMKPNIVYVNHISKSIHDLAYPNSGSLLSWEVDHPSQDRTVSNALIQEHWGVEVRYKIEDPLVAENLGANKLVFLNFCFEESDGAFSDARYSKTDKIIVFQYNGKSVCPIIEPDTADFLSKNLPLSLILILSSAIGLFLSREHERLSMSITSVQSSIIMCTLVIITTANLQSEEISLYSGIFTVASAFVAFGFSYFNRFVALFFVWTAVANSITWSLSYVFVLVAKKGVYLPIFVAGVVLITAAIFGLSCSSAKIQELYTFVLYSSIANSFYLCLGVSIVSKMYLDIIYFGRYEAWGKQYSIKLQHVLFLIVYLALSVSVIYVRTSRETKNREEAIQMHSQLFKQEQLLSSNEQESPQYGENETVIAM
jgi:hypothetical protein